MATAKQPIMPVNLSYGVGLTLDTAKKMLEAGEKEAEEQGVPMVIAICDAGGNLLALHRMDKAPLVSVQIAINKAFTAVFGKKPTGRWKSLFSEGEITPLFFHERWITFWGGFPIIKNEIIVGGIGVSGGTVEDLYVARAALRAGGFSLKDADDDIAKVEATKEE